MRTIGWVNFLDDRSQAPHLKLTAIDKAFGVGESTGQGKSMLIRKMLKIRPRRAHWIVKIIPYPPKPLQEDIGAAASRQFGVGPIWQG